MDYLEEYREIYNKEVLEANKGIILAFMPYKDKYTYKTFCHGISDDSVEKLAELMRHNLLFYCFGEDEVVDYYKKGYFSSIETAAKYAYMKRLPKRTPNTDGLPGEVLLDLLIQLYTPDAYKLTVRTLLRQNDNNEIKGYDLTYFTRDSSGISLWLGQAKLGGKEYCKQSINKDLLTKYVDSYLSQQLFFICDKRIHISDDAKAILEAIERINIATISDDDISRSNRLISVLNNMNIKIRIPCLLAYGDECFYKNKDKIYEQIENEKTCIVKYFNSKKYAFHGFFPEIIFFIFPIESIDRLRSKEDGFYAGLC